MLATMRKVNAGCADAKMQIFGYPLYKMEKTGNKWLLPVCSYSLYDRLNRLSPNHEGNWVISDIDGCETICYVFTGKGIKSLKSVTLSSAWRQFADRLGSGPAKEYFNDVWIRYNNVTVLARNAWEHKHGGIRRDYFNRGMCIRDAASMSIV